MGQGGKKTVASSPQGTSLEKWHCCAHIFSATSNMLWPFVRLRALLLTLGGDWESPVSASRKNVQKNAKKMHIPRKWKNYSKQHAKLATLSNECFLPCIGCVQDEDAVTWHLFATVGQPPHAQCRRFAPPVRRLCQQTRPLWTSHDWMRLFSADKFSHKCSKAPIHALNRPRITSAPSGS